MIGPREKAPVGTGISRARNSIQPLYPTPWNPWPPMGMPPRSAPPFMPQPQAFGPAYTQQTTQYQQQARVPHEPDHSAPSTRTTSTIADPVAPFIQGSNTEHGSLQVNPDLISKPVVSAVKPPTPLVANLITPEGHISSPPRTPYNKLIEELGSSLKNMTNPVPPPGQKSPPHTLHISSRMPTKELVSMRKNAAEVANPAPPVGQKSPPRTQYKKIIEELPSPTCPHSLVQEENPEHSVSNTLFLCQASLTSNRTK